MKKKILILSPINQWGGVNIDVGFIAQFYKTEGHQVYVLSLGDYYEDSSVFEFINHSEFNSLDRILYQNNRYFRVLLRILNWLKPLDKPLHHRTKNRIFTSLFPLKQIKTKILSNKIKSADVVFICHQFTGQWVDDIVRIAIHYNKKILFRVSGQINIANTTKIQMDILKNIDTFILHSYKNKSAIDNYFEEQQLTVIDQCVYLEHLYKRKHFDEKITSFYTLSRFDKLKNIATIIESFKNIQQQNITLSIYGEGNERFHLEKLAKEDKRIKIYGPKGLSDIHKIHNNHQCLIIASNIEAGPYTGLEAMAANNLIISTRVGAMEERLGEGYPYFYNGKEKQLIEKIKVLIQTDRLTLQEVSKKNREIYYQKYSYKHIYQSYIKLLNESNLQSQ